MSALAPVLEAYFTERLTGQRQASAHTVAAYRDTFCLLLRFTEGQTGKSPYQLDLADLDASLIGAFLTYLETERGVSVRTRNARLAAVRSLFKFASYRCPEHAALIQRVLSIPSKRTDRPLVSFLTETEVDALLASPNLGTWIGRRDHALLVVALQTGLRVSELTGLTRGAIELGTGAHLRCRGKGRKDRITPLSTKTRAVLRAWLAERSGGSDDPVFPGPTGSRLSRDAVRRLVERHVGTAIAVCPSLSAKVVSPHVLRHTCAMNLLRHGVDTAVIALWLGHEDVRTTQIYIHADLSLKERALARTAPPHTSSGRYQPPDQLLAFLESL
jgi:integrase/recombinase XerD